MQTMITLSYLHLVLAVVLLFGLLCALIHTVREDRRKRKFIGDFQNVLMRAVRSPRGVEINVQGNAWCLSLKPVKAAEDTENAETQEIPQPAKS